MHYKDLEFVLDVPEDWDNRTIVAFTAPKDPNKAVTANLTVTRDKLEVGDSLDQYANRQLVQHARTANKFKLLIHTPTTLGEVPAVEISFTWESEGLGAVFHQRQLLVQGKQGICSFMITALEADYNELESQFNSILATVRLS